MTPRHIDSALTSKALAYGEDTQYAAAISSHYCPARQHAHFTAAIGTSRHHTLSVTPRASSSPATSVLQHPFVHADHQVIFRVIFSARHHHIQPSVTSVTTPSLSLLAQRPAHIFTPRYCLLTLSACQDDCPASNYSPAESAPFRCQIRVFFCARRRH